MNWRDFAEIRKRGSHWEVSFRFTDCDEFEFTQLPVDEFVGYSRTKWEAEELADEWLIQQAQQILWHLDVWDDQTRSKCPHCLQITTWQHNFFDLLWDETKPYEFYRRGNIAPHNIPKDWLEGDRYDRHRIHFWECDNCKEIVQ